MAKTYSRGAKPAKADRAGLAPKKPKPPVPEPQGEYGSFTGVDPRYLFGEPEEIDDRVATGYKLGGTNPAERAPAFVQIRPGPTSKSANDPAPIRRSGDSKFGSPRKYI